MTREEKLIEAKLMAVENILLSYPNNRKSSYETAQDILEAIRNEEIKAELAEHEASLETEEKVLD